jgi:two-component system response regulator DctR
MPREATDAPGGAIDAFDGRMSDSMRPARPLPEDRSMHSRLCLIDDDEATRESLAQLFASRGRRLSTYADGASFLDAWLSSDMRDVPSVLIVDVDMPRMTGVELFAAMRRHGVPAHNVVLFLSGRVDIPTVVEVIKSGAHDFLQKPFDSHALVERVFGALQHAESRCAEVAPRGSVLDRLTHRELQIAERIAAGKTNGTIAEELAISVRTVECHRASLFRKLLIRRAVELVPVLLGARSPQRAAAAGA